MPDALNPEVGRAGVGRRKFRWREHPEKVIYSSELLRIGATELKVKPTQLLKITTTTNPSLLAGVTAQARDRHIRHNQIHTLE